jgi:hypothetical protein
VRNLENLTNRGSGSGRRTLSGVTLSGPIRTIVVEPLEVPEPKPKPEPEPEPVKT